MNETKIKEMLNDTFSKLSKIVVENMADEREAKGPLLQPRNAYIDQKIKSGMDTFTALINHIKDCASKVSKLLNAELLSLPPEKRDLIKKELANLSSKINGFSSSGFENANFTLDTTFQELLGLSQDTMSWFYSVGYKFFEKEHKEESMCIFYMLTLLNPLNCNYWIALGITQRSLKEETEALYSFEMASSLDKANPIPKYNSLEIYLDLGKMNEAKKEFYALEEIIQKEKRTDLQPALEFLRNRLNFAKAS